MFGVATGDIASFLRRLVTLLKVGVPINQALSFLTDEEDPRMRAAVDKMVGRVETGSRLSQAMADHDDIFPNLAIQMVRAGESSGRLAEVLEQLAEYLERTVRLSQKLRAAFTYPAMLLLLTGVLVIFMGVFVFPKEKEMLESMGAELPLLTQILILVMDTITHPALLILASSAVATAVVLWLTIGKQFYNTYLRAKVDDVVLKLPVVGPILYKAATSRMLFAMASLLGAGVTMGKPMAPVAAVANNERLKANFLESQKALMNGKGLYESFAAANVFPPIALQLFRVGEEQGRLDDMCNRMATMLEEEVEHSLAVMAALMEPAALFIMGGVVGFVVLATALPTMKMLGEL